MLQPKYRNREAHDLIDGCLRETIRTAMGGEVKIAKTQEKLASKSEKKWARASNKKAYDALKAELKAAERLVRYATAQIKMLVTHSINCHQKLDLSEFEDVWPTPSEMTEIGFKLSALAANCDFEFEKIDLRRIPLFLIDLTKFDPKQYVQKYL